MRNFPTEGGAFPKTTAPPFAPKMHPLEILLKLGLFAKKKRYTNVYLFFLCAALLLCQHDRPAAEHFIRLEWFRSFFFGVDVL